MHSSITHVESMFHLIDHAVKIFWKGALAYKQVEGIERNTILSMKNDVLRSSNLRLLITELLTKKILWGR